jgi:hypothetical protein
VKGWQTTLWALAWLERSSWPSGDARRASPLFANASETISALRRSSAYILLSRQFSSSSALSSAITEVSIPPSRERRL